MIVDSNLLESYLSASELQAIQPPEDISFWDWLDKYFNLDRQSSAVAGRYPRELVPYFRIVAEWLDDRKIKQVTWRKSAQEGVTTFAIGYLLYRQYKSPAPAMLCMADENTVQRLNETRLQPALKALTCFENLTFFMKQDEIRLSSGGSLLMAWASSIARTASNPIRDEVIDEITKPAYSLNNAEGDSISRILERCSSYPNRKALVMSTPTLDGDKLHSIEQSADAVYFVHVPCPHCGTFQPLNFFAASYIDSDGNEQQSGCIVWDNDLPTKEQKARSARYKCGHCEQLWTNTEKIAALQHCIAVPDREPDPDSESRFLVTWRILSPRDGGNLTNIVRGFLDAKEDVQKLQSFYNNVLGMYWTDRISKPTDQLFESYRLNYQAGTVPDDAVCLIASVDVQKRGFYYIVRAWTAEETSYKIEHGFVSTEAELNHIIFEKTWQSTDGRFYGIWRCGIDTGGSSKQTSDGNEIGSTEYIYRWYLKNRGRGVQLFLLKGSSKALPSLLKIGNPLMSTPSGKPIKNGLQIVLIDTNKSKDTFFWRVDQTKQPEPVTPAYTSKEPQEDYIKQLKAEEKRRDRKTSITKWVQISADNHYLDCEAQQIALASRELHAGVSLIKRAITCGQSVRTEKVLNSKPVKKRKPQPSGQSNWLND